MDLVACGLHMEHTLTYSEVESVDCLVLKQVE